MTDDLGTRFGSDERQAWIALASVPGIGSEWLGHMLAQFRSTVHALEAAQDGTLEAWNRLFARTTERIAFSPATLAAAADVGRDPARALRTIAERGLWTYTSLDSDFPPRLRDLDPPPAVIHGLGDRTLLAPPRSVAIVGTRHPTAAGRALASRIAARLVEAGAVVVSGLAVGIDGAAHAAVVERQARTVGVIGAGHDHPGPRAHSRLRDEIWSTAAP